MSIVRIVEELINKAKGGVAEAADHTLSTPPKNDEQKKETNAANSGTHPKSGGQMGGKGQVDGGEGFKVLADDDTIGPEGKADPARPGTIKHEGGGTGPAHPGTATKTQSQQKSSTSDLEKGFPDKADKKKKDDESDESAAHEAGESDDDEREEHKKSMDGEVYLDIDDFAAEITKSVTASVLEAIREEFAPTMEKSMESEFVEAGLAKSVAASLDRIEQLEKAIVGLSEVMSMRKSVLSNADRIGSVGNPSLGGGPQLSKAEVSSKLLDMQMAGVAGVDTNMVLRYDAVGDINIIPEAIRTKLGY